MQRGPKVYRVIVGGQSYFGDSLKIAIESAGLKFGDRFKFASYQIVHERNAQMTGDGGRFFKVVRKP